MKENRKSRQLKVFTAPFILYLLFIFNFFLHMPARIPGLGYIRPTLLLVGLIVISILFSRKRNERLFVDDLSKALFALLIYLVVSLPLVEFPGSVLRENAANLIKVIVFFFFTVAIVKSFKQLWWLIGSFIVLQVFRVLEPLYLNITQGYWGDRTYLGSGEFAARLAGAPADVINPNELGFVIATVIPFIHYLLLGRGRLKTIAYVCIIPMLAYALVLTMSRGAFLALIVVGWLVFRESKHKTMLISILIAGVFVLWQGMSPAQKDRYLSIVDSDTKGSATFDGRLKGIVTEFKLGLERPVVGHGVGTTGEARFHSYGGWYVSHNMYAELLIEIGIIGAILFLRFMALIKKQLYLIRDWLTERETACQNQYALMKALIAVFWMYVVYSFNYWGLTVYYWYFLGGVVAAFYNLSLSERSALDRRV